MRGKLVSAKRQKMVALSLTTGNAPAEPMNEAEVFQVLKNIWLQVLMEFNLTPSTLALIMITTILIISA
eukprot:CAMPEP_0175821328 /NCGR_PEP_ID=MMETSP0107_2-20121207/9080_1 /TAXON_ID=195067 ORGANISM="Goniomonas pacifica, Strain CCMP1869" /NCGR_SAMPLE_ID=MMETSP0107_2 /ASSEMBLY_ACC=CAM_ASM_000203 /LENGTH=68 /DNA_ID=CAMNT_0017133707 /DNA_START=54 /DNA_END=256 /DNA_ORIENTATION=+